MPNKDKELRKIYAKQYRELYKEKAKEYQKLYRAVHDSTEYKAEWYKRKRFERYKDLTKEKYFALLESQHNRCAICQKSFSDEINTYIDHCHNTLDVRGILCFHCNTGIGHLRDNPMFVYRALCYLEKVNPHD